MSGGQGAKGLCCVTLFDMERKSGALQGHSCGLQGCEVLGNSSWLLEMIFSIFVFLHNILFVSSQQSQDPALV